MWCGQDPHKTGSETKFCYDNVNVLPEWEWDGALYLSGGVGTVECAALASAGNASEPNLHTEDLSAMERWGKKLWWNEWIVLLTPCLLILEKSKIPNTD